MTGFQILLLALVATQCNGPETEKTIEKNKENHKERQNHQVEMTYATQKEHPHADYRSITAKEAHNLMRNTGYYAIVDVRTPEEYRQKRITGAINIPNETILSEPIPKLPDMKQPLFVYCEGGGRSKRASQKLSDIGYENVYEMGGLNEWGGSISR